MIEEVNEQEMEIWLCRRNAARCKYCHRASTRLCDFTVAEGKTCDLPMCDFCTHRAERTVDYCRDHRGSVAHRPRKDENAPRWMKSLFAGHCRLCAKTVWKGDKMLWFKKEKKLYCETCGLAIMEAMKTV